jgi:cell division protein FtsL
VAPRGRTSAALGRFARARAEGLADRLLRGRLWVGCIGALLAGIVFLNVSLLQLNQDIAKTGSQATTLDRQNSRLRVRLASLDSSERIQKLAAARGMLMPAPGEYRYLRSRPWLDAALAARRVSPPRPLPTAAATAAAPAPATAAATSAGQAAAPATTSPSSSGQTTGSPAPASTQAPPAAPAQSQSGGATTPTATAGTP